MKIEIFKPFGEAFELMQKILFRPFDLGKWCTIGFAAFLANLGGGYNFNFNYNREGNAAQREQLRNFMDWLHQIPSWIWISGIAAAAVLIITICVVFAWLRARGRLMFIDCIVKNRGAIAEPWREFKTEGNSFFLFSLVVGVLFAFVLVVLALPFLIPIFRRVAFLHLHDAYMISMLVLWATVIFMLAISWALVAQIMVPVMYRRKCRAAEALRCALGLISNYPGEIVLYCLFWVVLCLAAFVVGCLSTCVTCCLTVIPYVGTVILLPLFVCLRAFSLLFLRQFGPDYDVWATLPPPPSIEPPPLPVSPPPEP